MWKNFRGGRAPGAPPSKSALGIFKLILQIGSWSISCEMWSKLSATEPHEVNTGSGNDLVPRGKKPLPEPTLTQIYAVFCVNKPQWVKQIIV